MSSELVSLRDATEDDLPYVERLLERNDLPTADVQSKSDCFSVASVDGDPVGVVGLEQYGTVGLLRSLAVERAERGNGYGRAICDALETSARREGVETLYLLTTTAADFFADRGYVEIEREDAPDVIRETTEFAVRRRRPV